MLDITIVPHGLLMARALARAVRRGRERAEGKTGESFGRFCFLLAQDAIQVVPTLGSLGIASLCDGLDLAIEVGSRILARRIVENEPDQLCERRRLPDRVGQQI